MSKSVLISIQPKWCELIANGKKTIEVRKNRPKLDTPFKCYIYCTKSFYRKGDGYFQGKYCGKVIGEFKCREITYLGNISTDKWDYLKGNVHEFHKHIVTEKACLTENELLVYGGEYAWHISDLKIYDEPKELSKFIKCTYPFDCCVCDFWDSTYLVCANPIRPPQSWCYVDEI